MFDGEFIGYLEDILSAIASVLLHDEGKDNKVSDLLMAVVVVIVVVIVIVVVVIAVGASISSIRFDIVVEYLHHLGLCLSGVATLSSCENRHPAPRLLLPASSWRGRDSMSRDLHVVSSGFANSSTAWFDFFSFL